MLHVASFLSLSLFTTPLRGPGDQNLRCACSVIVMGLFVSWKQERRLLSARHGREFLCSDTRVGSLLSPRCVPWSRERKPSVPHPIIMFFDVPLKITQLLEGSVIRFLFAKTPAK